jgi:hypothetical protein
MSPLIILAFAAIILGILVSYHTNPDGMKDDFLNAPFPFNPALSPDLILIPYGYYFMKINDVKGIIKSVIKREENVS